LSRKSLSIEGLTIHDRLSRMAVKRFIKKDNVKTPERVFDDLGRMKKPVTLEPADIERDVFKWVSEMAERAGGGSVMARAFFESSSMIHKGMELVRSGQEETLVLPCF